MERAWKPGKANCLYFTGKTLMKAFSHTLVAAIGRRNLQNNSKLSQGFALDWELVDQGQTNMTAEERQRQSWMFINTNIMQIGRRLFESRRGSIGLVLAAAQVDDPIFVLMGG